MKKIFISSPQPSLHNLDLLIRKEFGNLWPNPVIVGRDKEKYYSSRYSFLVGLKTKYVFLFL